MKKSLVAALLMLASSSTFAYYCSYSTYIDDGDKYNSNGVYLGSSVSKSSAAAILRQNRVYSGSTACGLHNTNNRAKFEAKVRRSNLSPAVIRNIVNGNPYVTVEIFDNSVNVY
ncbi:hypothetical protein ACFBZI_03455 [Moraxella sp. ZJ142]|uniref:hypothetical protein n=1 Tax=Moraxella marmotae TaxID=3344520 RepID=UPI0035D3DE5B